jgi:hypothetical protein
MDAKGFESGMPPMDADKCKSCLSFVPWAILGKNCQRELAFIGVYRRHP